MDGQLNEALACKLAGYFFLAIDKKATTLQYFLHAHEKYYDWGTAGKCNGMLHSIQKDSGLTFDSTCAAVKLMSFSDAQVPSDDRSQRKRVITESV